MNTWVLIYTTYDGVACYPRAEEYSTLTRAQIAAEGLIKNGRCASVRVAEVKAVVHATPQWGFVITSEGI